jgi:hypothetical protein
MGAVPVAVPTPAVAETCTGKLIAGYALPGARLSLRVHVGVLALVQVQPEPAGVCAVAGSVTVRAVPVDVAAAETSS